MAISRTTAIWTFTVAGLALAAAVYGVSKSRELMSISGAVLRDDPDLGKQLPISGAQVSVDDELADAAATTDSSGLFRLSLKPGVHIGQMATIRIRHPDYRVLNLSEFLQDRLYVVRLVPLNTLSEPVAGPPVVISDIRVRYATRSRLAVESGSALKTFEVVNAGDVPCEKHDTCSPDGKWKASIGGVSLDAGENSVFQEARVSCVAGPCPFTKIEKDSFSEGGRHIGVTVRNWSDTTTFLLEAEVVHTTDNDVVLQAFPAIFDRAMSFTLPAAAQGPSIEAAINGADIVFPLGPKLSLSWAACSVKISGNGTKLYRCALKPGYRFR